MGTEIERKFLVKGENWREGVKPVQTCQGYLATAENTVRVRLQEEKAFVTIKGKAQGVSRSEYEYEIPVADAREMLETLCMKPCIVKNRYDVKYAGRKWEVDEFHGENEGLIVAEIELESEEQHIDLPPWAGQEVSDDQRYSNVNLVKNPFSKWKNVKP